MSARGRFLLALVLAASAPQAWAQTCEAEKSAYRSAFESYYNRAMGPYVNDIYFTKPCTASEVNDFRGVPGVAREKMRKLSADRHLASNASNRAYIDMEIKGAAATACVFQAYVDRCSGASAPAAPAQAVPQAAPQAARAPAPAPTLRDPMGEAPEGKLSDAGLAARRAVDRQVAVEFHRGNKPKRHVPAAEAHQCLSVHKAGGFANRCDFAVEFSFCTYRAKKGSWAEFFDCEKGKSGSWQVGANARASVHTAAEYVHWFACRYGPAFSKPDGVSPADVEYKRDGGPPGRLYGRCAQWGAG